jgi:fatty acid desaturase
VYKSFRTNSRYLTSFHIKSAIFWIAACIVCFLLFRKSVSWFLIFLPGLLLVSSQHLLRVAAGLILSLGACFYCGLTIPHAFYFFLLLSPVWALIATAILHNASHGNIKPKWLCRIVGELFAVIQLVGFPDWVIVHVLHHSHPDDSIRDPHPPLDLNYWTFLNGMRLSILRVLLTEYFKIWGNTPETLTQIKRLALASRIDQIAKVVFWWLLLGPIGFSLFFAPSILFKMMHYAWFNFATHKTTDGQTAVVNLDRGLYRVVNSISFGLYYHKNHHENPKLFDPRKYKENQDRAA